MPWRRWLVPVLTALLLSASAPPAWAPISGGAGGGDVTGPASATDNRITVFDGSTGKVIKDGNVLIGAVCRRVGTLTTEQTTTSTSAVDLATISGLNIPTTSWIKVIGYARRTTGAAAGASLGLALNATVVSEAVGTARPFDATDEVQTAIFEWWIPPVATNARAYGFGSMLGVTATNLLRVLGTNGGTADRPNAATTSIIIRGISGNSAVTLAVDEILVQECLMN